MEFFGFSLEPTQSKIMPDGRVAAAHFLEMMELAEQESRKPLEVLYAYHILENESGPLRAPDGIDPITGMPYYTTQQSKILRTNPTIYEIILQGYF